MVSVLPITEAKLSAGCRRACFLAVLSESLSTSSSVTFMFVIPPCCFLPVHFLKRALLDFYFHIKKFTYFKCRIQWFFVNFQSCANIIYNPILEHFHHPKRSFVPLWRQSVFLPSAEANDCFLSLWIYLFWTFHLSGIIKYIVFGFWFLSFACFEDHSCSVSLFLSFLQVNNILSYGYIYIYIYLLWCYI